MSEPRNLNRRTLAQAGAVFLIAAATARPAPAQDTLPPREGGIGGTGIVGTLTGLQPLQINGLVLSQGSGTVFRDAFGRIAAASLRVGETVTILASSRSSGGLRATAVERMTPLIGVLQQDADGLSVNGVRLRPEAGVGPRTRMGDRVAISGLWDGTTVVATRIDPAREGSVDLVAGTLDRTFSGARIGGIPIGLSAWRVRVPDEGFGTVFGRFEGDRFDVARARPGRFRNQTAPSLRALSVEGYLERADKSPGYRVSGLGHSFDPAARLNAVAGRRTLFEGPYSGTFRVQTGLVLPEDQAARARVLAQMRPGGRILLR